ncbi:MAG: arsenosugar biosynthesis radical SAM protein ArsS [bacterium]|nr:arsenosugar biosynthesis radical SAM protein ArsS [bacterium]
MTEISVPTFRERLRLHDFELKREGISTLQINMGRLCNLACLHCHVEAGPKQTEIMTAVTQARLLELVDASSGVRTVDLTGGAPEMNPGFRDFVAALRARNIAVIDRCNLTILEVEGYQWAGEFFAENQVHVIASLPCYSKDNVEKQRGRGVFDDSILALRRLNNLGYAKDPRLRLDLVYNPLGASLPPDQLKLEVAYKKELREIFEIEFNQLYTITNMPIKRFLHQLERDGKLSEYMGLLASSFNLWALENVMCRNLVSISWDGLIYDCDFNQMLELQDGAASKSIWEIDSLDQCVNRRIAVADHCYGCTAGAGSSCNGAVA